MKHLRPWLGISVEPRKDLSMHNASYSGPVLDPASLSAACQEDEEADPACRPEETSFHENPGPGGAKGGFGRARRLVFGALGFGLVWASINSSRRSAKGIPRPRLRGVPLQAADA